MDYCFGEAFGRGFNLEYLKVLNTNVFYLIIGY